MARYQDGLKHPTHIFEAAAWHHTVKVICACGNSTTFDPHGLWWCFYRKGWDDRLTVARQRFWCRHCAGKLGKRIRPKRLELVRELPEQNWLPMPPEHEWKRMLRRFRG